MKLCKLAPGMMFFTSFGLITGAHRHYSDLIISVVRTFNHVCVTSLRSTNFRPANLHVISGFEDDLMYVGDSWMQVT